MYAISPIIKPSLGRLTMLGLLACLLVFYQASIHAEDAVSLMKAQYKRPASIPFPENNPYSMQKALLGKMLFFDARLSRDQNFTCASCHNPSFGWEVPLAKAVGAEGRPLPRSSPTVQNHAWSKQLFWDGRAHSLEAQARGPIEAKMEMGSDLGTVTTRLAKVEAYQKAFKAAFPQEGVTADNVLKAIATYERTLVSSKSDFDYWLDGNEQAIPKTAKNGFILFNTKANCVACHSGWNFTDNQFHDIGLADSDEGRYKVTKNPVDKFAMKTPSLRDAMQRAPYMHDGSLETLQAVVIHYASGGIKRPTLSPSMHALNLNQEEINDLVAFMQSLKSNAADTVLPNIPAK